MWGQVTSRLTLGWNGSAGELKQHLVAEVLMQVLLWKEAHIVSLMPVH